MRLSSFFCLVCSRTQWSLSAGGAKIIDACMFLNKISGICRNVNVIFLARTGTEFNETAKNFNKSNVYGCNMSALGERSVRIREVEGSNPFRSTKQVLDEHLFLQRRLRREMFALIHNRKVPSWE